MIWRVEIKVKQGAVNVLAGSVSRDIRDLGLDAVSKVDVIQVYTIDGDISSDEIHLVARDLLVDPVTQDFAVFPARTYAPPATRENHHIVEIAYHPGVMDPVEESTKKGIRDLGIPSVCSVHTSRQYFLQGRLSDQDMSLIVEKVLSNKLIQHVVKGPSSPETTASPSADSPVDVIKVPLNQAGDRRLLELSRQGQLFLNLQEMKAIQRYFKKQKREPTDCELETIAQTWSEHCHHKTFRGWIDYQEKSKGKTKKKKIRSLLKSTIMRATREINRPWCVSVFHDNAGVIRFDEEFDICFKVETHNHPSALEPFGGANTGVGGVIRDILGTGLGARPVANTDIFCFAPPDYPFEKLPAGTLHPKRVMKGVVSGVRDYGNKMGIPTINGAILFDDKYVGNPLVYCGNIGLLPRGKAKKKVKSGDLIVAVGGRTGRDGIHGATFSSGELTSESEQISSGAVQIGDPIQEKKVLDVLMQARDQNLYSAITDCGAGGFSSAVGEMAQGTGARVDLEKVPLKYQGLRYMEIWISESQERMVLSVPPKNLKTLLDVFAAENVEATTIGTFCKTGRLELFFHGTQVCDLDMSFLHDGIPAVTKKARWTAPLQRQVKLACPDQKGLTRGLHEVLAHYNVCSKENVVRRYDHEVQGGSIVKPFVGPLSDGPSDASVLAPRRGSFHGFAVANGINPRYGLIDPSAMAAACIDEALRQIIAVGGSVDKIALLDNFCWGNPDKPDRLGALVRAAEGCYKTAVGYGVPFISGKDSLYNEYTQDHRSIAIPGTILISAIGIIKDVRKCVTMDFKEAGNLVYIIGSTQEELGGSIYYDIHRHLGTDVPRVDVKKGLCVFTALHKAIQKGLVRAAHDCSDGGLAAALAEMSFAGGLGAVVSLSRVPYRGKNKRDDYVLFSESCSRFIAEVQPKDQKAFERLMRDTDAALVGEVADHSRLFIRGLNGNPCIDCDIHELKASWERPLKW